MPRPPPQPHAWGVVQSDGPGALPLPLPPAEAWQLSGLEQTANGSLLTDVNGVIRAGDAAAGRLLGVEQRFLPGKPLALYITPKSRAAFRAEVGRTVSGSGERVWQQDVQPRSGAPLRLQFAAAAMARSDGQIAFLRWRLRDLSSIDHRNVPSATLLAGPASDPAAAVLERQQALAEISRVLSSSLDLDTTLARAARLAVPLLGDLAAVYLLDDAQNATRSVLAHKEPDREAEIAALWDRYPLNLATSEPLRLALTQGETQVQNAIADPALTHVADYPDQLPYWRALRVSAVLCVPLRIRGRTLGAIAFISEDPGKAYDLAECALAEDVAQRAAIAIENARLYAEMQRAVRLRDEFLASISHDLRSPLATVKGSAQLIGRRLAKRAELDADAAFAHQLAGGITGAAETMANLIDQLLDLARQDARQPLALDLRETDLAALVRAAVEDAHAASGEPHINLALPEAPLVGRWDALRLRRVLDNLIGNAMKYGANGPIAVRLARAGSDGAQAVLSVADRGLGIPAADLPQIFERFHRGSNVLGQIPGTGIGLAGTRQIVKAHGGTIAIESVEGEGTTVTIELPLVPPSEIRPSS